MVCRAARGPAPLEPGFDCLPRAHLVDPVGRPAAAIAMGERIGARPVAIEQPTDLAGREAEHLGCLVERQPTGDDVFEDVGPVL